MQTKTLVGWEERVRQVTACRICGNPALEPVISLGSQALAGLFDDGRPQNQLKSPVSLEVVRCGPSGSAEVCGLIQLRHTVPPEAMFHDYGYRSGINSTMRRHLEELAAEAETMAGLARGDVVVDIGANDGTLLLAYSVPGLTRVAFEPSDVRPGNADHGLCYLPLFFSQPSFQEAFPGRKAKLVTAIAMLYDIDDPVGFCRQVEQILSDDGLWIVELGYWGALLRNTGFDSICHEHLGYYTLAALEFLARRTGFRIYDVAFNDSNGGSVRVSLVKAAGRRAVPPENSVRVRRALEEERRSGILDAVRIARFRKEAEGIRRELRRVLQEILAGGKKVYGYGASTKGNVLLQYCALTPREITAIADRNPEKHGRRTPGTGIPICSEEEMRRARPDFLLILPWHFLSEFLDRERPLRDAGTRFIVPFPSVRVV